MLQTFLFFQQRMVDPRVDILRADWSPFSTPDWTMPLLSSLTDWRRRLMEIREEFRRTAVETEERAPSIVFAADFPGLSLENFVQRDVDKVQGALHGHLDRVLIPEQLVTILFASTFM